MTDSAGLAGNAAALYGADNVKFAFGSGYGKWLPNDELQGSKAKVIVNIAAVNCNFTSTGVNSYAGYGIFYPACAIEKWFALVHIKITTYNYNS